MCVDIWDRALSWLIHSSPYILGQSLSMSTEMGITTSLARQHILGIPCHFLLYIKLQKNHHTYLAFMWLLEMWNLVLMLAKHNLQGEQSLQPICNFVSYSNVALFAYLSICQSLKYFIHASYSPLQGILALVNFIGSKVIPLHLVLIFTPKCSPISVIYPSLSSSSLIWRYMPCLLHLIMPNCIDITERTACFRREMEEQWIRGGGEVGEATVRMYCIREE